MVPSITYYLFIIVIYLNDEWNYEHRILKAILNKGLLIIYIDIIFKIIKYYLKNNFIFSENTWVTIVHLE